MGAMTVGKIRRLVAVGMLGSAILAGCHFGSRNPPNSQTLDVPMGDVLKQGAITQNVTLAVGNTLTVKLGSNYSTPYRWAIDTTIGDSTIVKQTSHEFVHPTSDALGAPGTEVWTFTALKPGKTTISTAYTSIVGKNPPPACVYTANVTVQ
ncbi:protease inhibitor I42 family protein [Mycobacterium interjectum]|uniref:protease inhibitor I42 family protein n=1 Tax=Mycobacterium interjectum TaxID=33895 RepID=UPI000A05FDB9|nr:protease inhibitor I42 family protein [Mycobacterium interjectum]MCV7092697.1 protease inhibitor I42 family protein [Mycobacterium interjectum]